MILCSVREKLDAWLTQHEVDVCRLFAVYFLTGAAMGVVSNIVQFSYTCAYGVGFTFKLDFVVSFIFGVAFWLHKSWVRTVTLVFTWMIVLLFFVGIPLILLFALFGVPGSTTYTIAGMTLQGQGLPLWLHIML